MDVPESQSSGNWIGLVSGACPKAGAAVRTGCTDRAERLRRRAVPSAGCRCHRSHAVSSPATCGECPPKLVSLRREAYQSSVRTGRNARVMHSGSSVMDREE